MRAIKRDRTMKSIKDLFMSIEILNENMRISPDSADAQIDGLILNYQQESIAEGKLDSHFAQLLEAPADNEEEIPSAVTGDSAMATDQPAISGVKQIDLDTFAQKVVTLYQNYQQLLNLETVIINRSTNVLRNAGYDENAISEYIDILDRDFGISNEKEDEIRNAPAPPGGNAGPIS